MQLIQQIAEAARNRVDYIQLREKDLSSRELEQLARQAMEQIRKSGSEARLLINSRTDVALAAGADGVHLRSNDISPKEVRKVWREVDGNAPLIAVSCHTEAEVITASEARADFVVSGPVFEKSASPGVRWGSPLESLRWSTCLSRTAEISSHPLAKDRR